MRRDRRYRKKQHLNMYLESCGWAQTSQTEFSEEVCDVGKWNGTGLGEGSMYAQN